MQKVKQRLLLNKLSSATKLIKDLKDTKSNCEKVPDNENNLLSAIIDLMKDNVRVHNYLEARKNNLELQRENSKMCLVM